MQGLMVQLRVNHKAYDKLIKLRIEALDRGETNHIRQFKAQEKRLNEEGVRIRTELGWNPNGELMWCPECGRFFTPLAHSIMPNFLSCRQHRVKEPVRV